MAVSDPCLNLAIARLSTIGNQSFAIWVVNAPYVAGSILNDCFWSPELTQSWQAWQEMFALDRLIDHTFNPLIEMLPSLSPVASKNGQSNNYSSRLMQDLGINLSNWLFQGSILNTLEHSIGIANGKNKPLRLRLDIRDPDLIALPWEIMQSFPGKPSISLSPHLLFSRTTNNVESLPTLPVSQSLNVLLAIGANTSAPTKLNASNQYLHLEKEADILIKALTGYGYENSRGAGVKCEVDTLIQPTPEQLITQLETKNYNIFFYAGHGLSGPDGGIIYLQPERTINGTELGQVLTRCQVKLCVFNACWLAQPAISNRQALQNSSLAEVLIHHGVPAVLGMRDQITDEEALTFIQTFAQALAARHSIDRAVAIARQQLLTIYKFNFPAWTLPILYLHPEFDGELVRPAQEEITQLPENSLSGIRTRPLKASLRSLSVPKKTWSLQAGFALLGRINENNDIAIEEPWISKQHAKIFCRNEKKDGKTVPTFFISDNSRFGTLIFDRDGWQNIHRQEVPLRSGMQIKFGCSQGETFEFIVET
ncbi:CHAT domain-containing protein [Synechocystis sp. PCC 7509]|uniref:CHAT domain-containing protein n=1 Tax=Synechocystis sp. PCC 7509 TaxID=927677 RepID=UPI0002ACDB90|nr:CHAT domain-containing protein [Synechocystis sp. PCC 7509]